MRAVLLLPLACLAAAPDPAPQPHDSQAPINFAADHIELQDQDHRSILTGNVDVKQAEMTLNSQRMVVTYTGEVLNGGSPQASRMDASGDVVVRRPDQTARGAFGTYDLVRRVITLIGGVSLTQGNNTVNGGRLTLTLDTGRAVVDGAAVGGTGKPGSATQRGGRVTGTFTVPPRQDAPQPSPTPTPAHP